MIKISEIMKRVFNNKNRKISSNLTDNGIEIRQDDMKLLSLTIIDNEIGLNINTNFKLKICGNFEVVVDNKVDVTTYNDFNLDTWKSKLNLNSRTSKHIRDLKEAIEFRNESNEILRKHKIWVSHHEEILKKIDDVILKFQDEKSIELKCNEGVD